MAIKANGTILEFEGYQYARMIDGEVAATGTFGEMQGVSGELMFRAVYSTPWIESVAE